MKLKPLPDLIVYRVHFKDEMFIHTLNRDCQQASDYFKKQFKRFETNPSPEWSL